MNMKYHRILSSIRRLLLLLLLQLLLFSPSARAQGFIRKYSAPNWTSPIGMRAFQHADGSFRLSSVVYLEQANGNVSPHIQWIDVDAQGQQTGRDTLLSYYSTYETSTYIFENGNNVQCSGGSGSSLVVRMSDIDGGVLWENVLPNVESGVLTVRANQAGEIFVKTAGFGSTVDSATVLKFSPDGALLWSTVIGISVTPHPFGVFPTPDGGCVVGTRFTLPSGEIEQVRRLDNAGNTVWSFKGSGTYTKYTGLYQDLNRYGIDAADNIYFLANQRVGFGQDSLFLEKIAPDGSEPLRVNISDSLNLLNGQLRPQMVFVLADGSIMIGAAYDDYNTFDAPYLVARLYPDGRVMWHKWLDFLRSDWAGHTLMEDGYQLPDGNLVLYGEYYYEELFLVKMSPEGVIYPNTIIGQTARDSTFNCIVDSDDPPLGGWVVSAKKPGDYMRYTATNAAGYYSMSDIDTGTYVVTVYPPSYLWHPCDDTVPVTFTDTFPQTGVANFPIQAMYDCALMQVDMGAVGLRRCFPNTYSVHYCNAGNQPADPAILTVTLDPLVTLDSASAPYTINGDEISFNLGIVPAGFCDNIALHVTVSCDAELGQTLCAQAHISPDTICAADLPGWSGAIVEVSALCDGDSLRFTIRNAGAAQNAQNLDFIVVDDHVITRMGSFNLTPDGTLEQTVPADGSTWRLIAEQEPGFPFGIQPASVAVEGCVSGGGPFSIGMLNSFANFTGDPFDDMACYTVVSSFDPNDKQAFPTGVEPEHFIEPNQPVEYLIRFQNTGTDTAFTVVLRDTLSSWLDPATIRPGASSHAYTWQISSSGTLTFLFNNILLPDSNVNEAASHGFIQFWIDQKKDVPVGTVIENRAGIYFDFNAPVMTNTVFHTIGMNFLAAEDLPDLNTLPALDIWPNPAQFTASVQAPQPFRSGDLLVLRDLSGRLLRTTPAQAALRREGLPSGLYFVEWRDAAGRVLGAGKLIWQ